MLEKAQNQAILDLTTRAASGWRNKFRIEQHHLGILPASMGRSDHNLQVSACVGECRADWRLFHNSQELAKHLRTGLQTVHPYTSL